MTVVASRAQRFARRTSLAPHEYHKNFHKIDEEVITCITSPEADGVTPLMSKIYLRLFNAPCEFWEQKGVLRFTAQEKEGKLVKASTVLCDYLGVARATVNKALKWMHEQGIIGYFAAKNGVGIRIFLNRATSSIGVKPTATNQKILQFPGGSSDAPLGSQNEPAFKDTFGIPENSETDLNPHAPKNGADKETFDKNSSDPATSAPVNPPWTPAQTGREAAQLRHSPEKFPLEELVAQLRRVLEPSLKAAAISAAQREHERTREWLDKQGIPKATRVAQREAYNVLRKSGMIADAENRRRADMQVGRAAETCAPTEAHPLSAQEITDIAETCVALLEAQGKSIEVTLSEISAEGGGWLLAEDAPKVRQAAHALINAQNERRATP